jgi:hypothetical protein
MHTIRRLRLDPSAAVGRNLGLSKPPQAAGRSSLQRTRLRRVASRSARPFCFRYPRRIQLPVDPRRPPSIRRPCTTACMLLFLSHASADAPMAGAIEQQVRDLGHEVYLAEHDQRAGVLVSNKVHGAIRRSHVVVALLTPAGFDSHYVHQEIGAAQHARKLVIPLLDTTLAHADLAMLNGLEYILLDRGAPGAALRSLSDRVTHLAQEQRDELIAAVAVMAVVVACGVYLYSQS